MKSHCRSCDEPIMWVKTSTGKNMPIDYDQDLEYLFDYSEPVRFHSKIMQSHFATCQQADKHRRR